MITAKQARDNVILSKANVQQYLDKIDALIISASHLGKSKVEIGIVGLSNCVPTASTVIATAIQIRVIDELRNFGYQACVDSYGERYIPRGMQDDVGEGPMHVNVGIIISW